MNHATLSASTLIERTYDGPLGPLRLVARGDALIAIYFSQHRGAPRPLERAAPAPHTRDAVLDHAARELDAYFAAKRTTFTVRTAAVGTEFQRRVWAELARIPYGETRSYAAIARALGCPASVRAVGNANGRNPLSIIVPCHRVIASDGSLAGYAGGADTKAWLLAHERRTAHETIAAHRDH